MGGGHKNDRLDIPMGLQGNYEKSHGAVVTKPILDYAVVGGNPAKIIRFRNQK